MVDMVPIFRLILFFTGLTLLISGLAGALVGLVVPAFVCLFASAFMLKGRTA